MLSQEFFMRMCNSNKKVKKLMLHGTDIYHNIRRRLEDADIPVLLIFLETNPDVIFLNLAYNNITDIGFTNLIEHIAEYKNIQELHLQYNNISKTGISHMCRIGSELQILSLQLDGNKFGVEGSQELASFLLSNSYLLNLSIANVDQTASSLIHLITNLRNDENWQNIVLKALDISRPNLGYVDTEHLADVIGCMLKCNTTLVELYLQKYGFDCHDIEIMMLNAHYNYSLHTLDLGSNNIGDHGIFHLAKWLITRPALKALILCRNIILDTGARELSLCVPFSKLTVLDISYNKITDNGILDICNSLKKTPPIQHLRIYGNYINHSCAKIIQRMLLSKVLMQEMLDVKPYRINHEWYLAQYPAASYNVKCIDNFNRNVYFKQNMHTLHTKCDIVKLIQCRESKCTAYQDKPITNKSIRNTWISEETEEYDPYLSIDANTSETSEISEIYTIEECICNDYDDYNMSSRHSLGCARNRRKEKEITTSSTSLSKSTSKSSYLQNYSNHIKEMLKSVNSKTRQTILRWINIDENALGDNINIFDEAEFPKEIEEMQGQSTTACNCSWMSLTLPALLQYINGTPIEMLLSIQDTKSISLMDMCQCERST